MTNQSFTKRYIRDGQNPFEFYNEEEFQKRYRFNKESVLYGILPKIEEGLAKINKRGAVVRPPQYIDGIARGEGTRRGKRNTRCIFNVIPDWVIPLGYTGKFPTLAERNIRFA